MPISQGAFATIDVKQIKGLMPAVDPRALSQPFELDGTNYQHAANQPFVIDGSNFLLDLKGPFAAWANTIPTYDKIYNPQLTKTFRILNDIFIITFGCVLKYDSATSRYYAVFTFNDAGTQWPWSQAEIAGKFYFCRRGAGVFQYDPVTSGWNTITTNLTTDPVSICQSQGRLIILGLNFIQWSAQDNGADLAQSLSTGAGTQGLSIISAKGYPLGVLETSDGFISYTEKGCVKSELSGGASVFRHYPLSKGVVPINQFCFINDGNKQNIVLDRKGFFVSSGGAFQPYQQLFGEWLSHEYIKKDQLNFSTLMALWYNEDAQLLILSLGQAANATLYTKAYVLYLPRDEWGSFDYNHTGFGEISFTDGVNKGFNFGFFDISGYFHRFITDVFAETAPNVAADGLYFYQPYFTVPTRIQDGVYVFASIVHMYDYQEAIFSAVPGGIYELLTDAEILGNNIFTIGDNDYSAGTHAQDVTFDNYATDADVIIDWQAIADGTADEDWGIGEGYYVFSNSIDTAFGTVVQHFAIYEPTNNPLNSFVKIGLFVYDGKQYDDQLSTIYNVSIGIDAIPGSAVLEDYATESPPSEDWNAVTGADEDWGFGFTQVTSFIPTLIGSIDGSTPWSDQTENLTLELDGGNQQFFSCSNTGLYHILEMSALEVNQTFHLKSLQLTGTLAGRL